MTEYSTYCPEDDATTVVPGTKGTDAHGPAHTGGPHGGWKPEPGAGSGSGSWTKTVDGKEVVYTAAPGGGWKPVPGSGSGSGSGSWTKVVDEEDATFTGVAPGGGFKPGQGAPGSAPGTYQPGVPEVDQDGKPLPAPQPVATGAGAWNPAPGAAAPTTPVAGSGSFYGNSTVPPKVVTAGARRTRPAGISFMWCTMLLVFGFFAQGITALSTPASSRQMRRQEGLPDAIALAEGLVANFETYLPGSELAENLVTTVLAKGCTLMTDVATGTFTNPETSRTFATDFSTQCKQAINELVVFGAPEIQNQPGGVVLLQLGAGQLCSYLVSSIFYKPELVGGICGFRKPCTDSFFTDPFNCGRCGNVCASGSCQRGACTSELCDGGVCEGFSQCGPGFPCVCASTSEGTGFCVDGDTSCLDLPDCGSSDDCPAGQICGIGSCCGRNVCIGATFCTASTIPGTSPSGKLMKGRSYHNATIASLGTWKSG